MIVSSGKRNETVDQTVTPDLSLPKLPFTLYRARSKSRRLLLVLVACSAFRAFLIWRGNEVEGWILVGFFALSVFCYLSEILWRPFFLSVSKDGIEFRTLFRVQRVRWSDISEFQVYTVRSHGAEVNRAVGFNYSTACNVAWIAAGSLDWC